MMRPASRLLLLTFVMAFFTVPAMAGEIYLSAAASLRDVISELTEGFARQNPGVRFLNNFGGSGALAKQIENGAPTDIFISANREWMDYVKERKLMDVLSVCPFAANELVFVGDPAKGVHRIEDVPKLERIAIGSPRSVPAGAYALDALRASGIGRQLGNRLVMARDVRECLQYAERGEVDGAFVYRTDVVQARRVKVLFSVPRKLYPRILYFIGRTTAGVGNKDSAAGYAYLLGGEGRVVLQRYGFILP